MGMDAMNRPSSKMANGCWISTATENGIVETCGFALETVATCRWSAIGTEMARTMLGSMESRGNGIAIASLRSRDYPIRPIATSVVRKTFPKRNPGIRRVPFANACDSG